MQPVGGVCIVTPMETTNKSLTPLHLTAGPGYIITATATEDGVEFTMSIPGEDTPRGTGSMFTDRVLIHSGGAQDTTAPVASFSWDALVGNTIVVEPEVVPGVVTTMVLPGEVDWA